MKSSELDELHFYCAETELHGIAWFSSITHPNVDLKLFTQSSIPVIHNYPLVLALAGLISEESYVTGYGLLKNTGPPAKRFEELGVYAYPMQLTKVYYRSVLMSLAETDYVFYKPLTRVSVPLLTRHTVMTPGTEGWTVIISREELPREVYIRLGVKRFGTWRFVLEKTIPSVVDSGVTRLSSPFNVQDTDPGYYAGSPLIVLKHYAGDVAISGTVKRALKLECRGRTVFKPVPFFLTP